MITALTTSATPPPIPAQRDELAAALLQRVPSRPVHGRHCGCCASWAVAQASYATLDQHAERVLLLAALARRDAARAAQAAGAW